MQAELKQLALQTAGKIIDDDMDEPRPGWSSVIDYMQLHIGQIFSTEEILSNTYSLFLIQL